MVPPTQNQIDSVPTEATYGGLIAVAADDAATARVVAVGPFQNAHLAAAVVGDVERFLAVVGRHLELLLTPAPFAHPRPSTGPHHLAAALSTLSTERHGANAWTRAGDHLGIAHDLLSTHVGPRGEFRTPEAVLLGDADVQVAAIARVTGFVDGTLAVAPELLEAARQIQPSKDPPLSPGTTTHVRHIVTRLEQLIGPARTGTVTTSPQLAALDELPPARTQVGTGTSREQLGSGLATLRLLRQLLYRQSKGIVPANAHSLQELCDLAVATCTTAEKHLPYAGTPLERVTRASAIDRLRTASTLWGCLSARFYPRIQGLAKAPAIFHDAVQTLTRTRAVGVRSTERSWRPSPMSPPRQLTPPESWARAVSSSRPRARQRRSPMTGGLSGPR